MKETVIRFLGKDLKIKSVCDDFVRLEYSEEFRAPGEFSCTLSLDRAYIPAIGEYALIGAGATPGQERRAFRDAGYFRFSPGGYCPSP